VIDLNILRMMVAEGSSASAIVRVVEMMVERDEARRKQWAESQRRTRAKRVETEQVVKYIPSQQTIVDSQQTSDPHIKKKVSKKDRKKDLYAKTPFPEDFTLNETDLAVCQQVGWTPEKIEIEFMRFRDHAHAHGRQCVDWHAAWRSWVRSPYSNGGINGHQQRPQRKSAADVARELVENSRREASFDFDRVLPESRRIRS
jgi:hypothetical protein